MFFAGAIGLYALICFYPDPFVRTITEQIETRNVTVTDTGIADAVEKLYDAVVVVKTYYHDQLYATGTGFVYKKDDNTAYILTNNHVIENGDAVYVEFTDGRQIETTVEGKDTYSDIAVLSLSADEVSFAGGVYGTNNTSFYLYTGLNYWTMTPYEMEVSGSVFSRSYAAKNMYVGSSLNNNVVSNSYGVRPVINIKGDIQISSGTGTSSDPYVVVE